jgi:hypothetical protein
MMSGRENWPSQVSTLPNWALRPAPPAWQPDLRLPPIFQHQTPFLANLARAQRRQLCKGPLPTMRDLNVIRTSLARRSAHVGALAVVRIKDHGARLSALRHGDHVEEDFFWVGVVVRELAIVRATDGEPSARTRLHWFRHASPGGYGDWLSPRYFASDEPVWGTAEMTNIRDSLPSSSGVPWTDVLWIGRGHWEAQHGGPADSLRVRLPYAAIELLYHHHSQRVMPTVDPISWERVESAREQREAVVFHERQADDQLVARHQELKRVQDAMRRLSQRNEKVVAAGQKRKLTLERLGLGLPALPDHELIFMNREYAMARLCNGAKERALKAVEREAQDIAALRDSELEVAMRGAAEARARVQSLYEAYNATPPDSSAETEAHLAWRAAQQEESRSWWVVSDLGMYESMDYDTTDAAKSAIEQQARVDERARKYMHAAAVHQIAYEQGALEAAAAAEPGPESISPQLEQQNPHVVLPRQSLAKALARKR